MVGGATCQDDQQDVYRGYNTYVVIERNNGECPLRNPITDGVTENAITNMNGVSYINPAFASPYDTFENYIATHTNYTGYIFNTFTGEGRYYDGTQGVDVDNYNTIMERAIGKTKSAGIKVTRTVSAEPEMSEMYPSYLKSGTYETSVDLEKFFIDKRRLEQTGISENVYNQYGFMGISPIEVDELENALAQDYHLVILYIKDLGGDSLNKARSIVLPCAKFETFNVETATKSFISCDLSGKATYFESVPNDNLNIPTYENTWDEEGQTCSLFLTIADTNYSNIVGIGDDTDSELWCGNTFLVNSDREICQADVYIEEAIDNGDLPDVQAKIYDLSGGLPNNQLGASDVVSSASITPGWNSFAFSSSVGLSTGTSYAVTFESTSNSATNNYYVVRYDNTDPYAGGVFLVTSGTDIGLLPNNWAQDTASDLWCRLYSLT